MPHRRHAAEPRPLQTTHLQLLATHVVVATTQLGRACDNKPKHHRHILPHRRCGQRCKGLASVQIAGKEGAFAATMTVKRLSKLIWRTATAQPNPGDAPARAGVPLACSE